MLQGLVLGLQYIEKGALVFARLKPVRHVSKTANVSNAFLFTLPRYPTNSTNVFPAYNITIKGTMKDANRENKVEQKTAGGFTTLVFLFTPLKSSAATVVAFTGLAFAAVLQVAF